MSGEHVIPLTRTGSPQDIHRPPPHSVEGEQGVLGSMLISPREAIAEMADKCATEYFYVPAHQTIFDVLIDLWAAGQAIDLITFTQTLRDRNLLDSVGGAAAVTNLYTFVPTAANIGYYFEIIRDKYILRSIIASSTESVRRAYEEQDDVGALLDDHQARAIEIGGLAQSRSFLLSQVVPVALEQILWRYRNRGKCTGISTGFRDLDRVMNGLEKGKRPYCFAARPAMGKSALMLAIAEHIAINAAAERKRVKIFSVEMTAVSLATRMIASRASLNLIDDVRFGLMDRGEVERAKEASDELMTDYIDIDDTGSISILQIRARARSAVMRGKCDLIMIDYLQRVHGSSKRSRENRQLEINEIAQGISEMTKELNVPVVVLAQLNRNPEDRKGGKPELGDLRESGSIEQEMGFVGLLWRPSYYSDNDADKRETAVNNLIKDGKIKDESEFDQYAECIVAKQNEGPVGPVPLRFVKDYARYEPQDPNRPLLSNRADQRQEIGGKTQPIVSEVLKEVQQVFPDATLANGRDRSKES